MKRLPFVIGMALLGIAVLANANVSIAADLFRQRRNQMVDLYIVPEGITNKAVVSSMRQVPRDQFVAPNLKDKAYYDQALSIGEKQTISPPFIVAYMTQEIDPQPSDRVLEIGTGSGYQAAVLSNIVKEVYTIEIVERLGRDAAKRLKNLGYKNVHTLIGDGYKGWAEHAPYDKIIVTCSPESVPKALIVQLKEGGKLLVPLGERYQQVFYMFEKKDGELTETKLQSTLFVPMTGISEEHRKVKPDPRHPQIRNGGFEVDADGKGHPEGWHYQRQLTVKQEDAPEGKSFVMLHNTEPGRPAQMVQGMGLDGSVIRSVRISLMLKGANLRPGNEEWQQPTLMIHFYDANRKPLDPPVHMSYWLGTFDWKEVSEELPIPFGAREAIMQIGLNGGTGVLGVDNVQLTPRPR